MSPQAFGGLPLQGVTGLAFSALLLAACVADLWTRRIPNWLVGAIALAGFVVAIAGNGWWTGGARALGGLAAGLCIWLPFWLLRMMGGGDVKFFAAGAAWIGAGGALEGALLAGLCGGVLSVGYLILQHGFGYTLLRISHGLQHPSALREETPSKWDRRMPYALAMSAGLALAAFRPGILI